MKRLYLLRHAKSSWDDPRLADHDRPLAPRGLRAAELLAAHMRRAGIAPERVLCSTSARTRETLELLGLDTQTAVEYDERLYAAPAQALLQRLREVGEETGSVMLIGHSSGIEELALLLAARGPRLDELREKFPTGALATLELQTAWSGLERGVGELSGYVLPRELSEG